MRKRAFYYKHPHSFTVTIKCMWCGQEIPILSARPRRCPWCGGML